MPRTIKADGRTITVPDDATDEEINQIVGPAPQSSPANQGFGSSFAERSGLTGLSKLASSIANPYGNDGIINNIKGIPSAISQGVKGAIDNAHQEADMIRTNGFNQETQRKLGEDVPIVGPALKQAQAQHDAGNDMGMAGTLAGTVAGLVAPNLVSKAIPLAGRALTGVGGAAEDAGVGVMNKTIGTLKNDFKHGANPAKGYFAGGGGPALSMGGLADKADAITQAAGQDLGKAYSSSTAVIPAKDVRAVTQAPIAKLRGLQGGFGGAGVSPMVDAYEANLQPTLNAADARGGFTPKELFDQAKRPLAQNTRWNDPTMYDLNTVRQETTGGIGGLLTDAVPGTADLNKIYQGSGNFAARAQSRAETHSMPFTSLVHRSLVPSAMAGLGALEGGHALAGGALGLALDSVPVKSALASGLYYGGKGAQRLGTRIASLPAVNPAAIAIPAYSLIKKKGDDANQ